MADTELSIWTLLCYFVVRFHDVNTPCGFDFGARSLLISSNVNYSVKGDGKQKEYCIVKKSTHDDIQCCGEKTKNSTVTVR